jgi:hypothetical protein
MLARKQLREAWAADSVFAELEASAERAYPIHRTRESILPEALRKTGERRAANLEEIDTFAVERRLMIRFWVER